MIIGVSCCRWIQGLLSDQRSDELTTVSLFDSRQAAAISIEKATAWVKENLADLYDGAPAEVSAAQVRSLPLAKALLDVENFTLELCRG